MSYPVRLCLTLHNHQPIGNFDGVFEQAYQDSYLPFMDVFDDYPELQISLHTSGPLMEWLNDNHPEYLDRVAKHVADGRIEIVGGPFYEPIMAMIPSRDRVGQIRTYTKWLENRLGADVQGMWMPERVWEQSMTADISSAGIQYTILDDCHFRNAGLAKEELYGYYVTEDNGHLSYVFPGCEKLRYLIPFQEPQNTIDYLREIGEKFDNAVVVFGDDGEKFGTWPDTKEHVYDKGWLRNFFQLLTDNRDWLKTTTLAEAVENTEPIGKVYIPDGSYREMTEWVLPTERQQQYEDMVHDFESDDRWESLKRFVRGGYWRNFKVKYPETNEMYSRMMAVSRRLEIAERDGCDPALVESARRELYKGQCNCSYWHGAFGGIYLPHLRNAVFTALIAADNILDQAFGRGPLWVEATAKDWDFDGRQEVRLENDRLVTLINPNNGGQIYELDVRSICHNVLATLARRPEAYHRKVLNGPSDTSDGAASIHDRVVFKQEGLDQRLQYDSHMRKSLMDHFYAADANLESVESGEAAEFGNFLTLPFETRVRRNPDRIQVMMVGNGTAEGVPIQITKGVTLEAGSSTLEIDYMLEGLPQDRDLHFGIEFNLAGLPSGADDRYFFDEQNNKLGQLGERLDSQNINSLGLADEWLGIRVQWQSDKSANMWTFPIETVSQSEGGFELVHQSVVLHPHWNVRGDAEGRWSVRMTLDLDTSLAENRQQASEAEVVG